MIFLLNLVSAVLALAAGALWLLSAKVKLPSEFPIVIMTTHYADPEIPAVGEINGTGKSQQIDDLGKSMIQQSDWSRRAALCACGSAFCQAAMIFLSKISN